MKRTLKMMLAAVLSLAMLVCFVGAEDAVIDESVISVHAEGDALSDFTDAPDESSWKYQGLNCVAENGIMVGHSGLIRPDDSLTRAELVTMMVRVLGAEFFSGDLTKFVDMNENAWYYDSISAGFSLNIINGSGNKMMPEAPITREQTFAILARTFLLMDKDGGSISSFNDASDVSEWAKNATNALIKAKVVLGDAKNTIRPKANVTRAEFAAMLDRIACYFVKPDVDYSGKTIDGSVIIRDSSVDLTGAVINGDIYVTEAIADDALDLSGVTVNGRIVVRSGNVTVADGDEDKVVTFADMPEEPKDEPVVVPPSTGKDDGKNNSDAKDSPNVSSTPSRPRPQGPSAVVGENTYITYSYNGGEVKKLYADVKNNVATFDFGALTEEIKAANGGSIDPQLLVFNKIYVESDKKALCKHDLISFYSNIENDLAKMLTELAGATNNVLVPIEDGDKTTLYDLIVKMDEAALANEFFPELFEALNIEVVDVDEAVFYGFIGSADFDFRIKM